MVGGIRWNSDMDMMCTLDGCDLYLGFDLIDCLGTCAMIDRWFDMTLIDLTTDLTCLDLRAKCTDRVSSANEF